MHHMMDQAIGAAPVSAVDVDAVIAEGRRRTFRRRLAIGGAAGGTTMVAAGVLVALTLTLAGTANPGTGATEAGRPPVIKVQPGSNAPGAPTHDGETRAQTAQRLATALTDAIVATIPGTHVSDGQTGQPPLVVSFDDSATIDGNAVAFPRFTAEAILSGTGSSEVFLQSRPGGAEPASTPSGPSGEPAPPTAISFVDECDAASHPFQFETHSAVQECTATSGPEGQTVILVSERCLDCSGQPVFRIDAYVTWANARVNVGVISVLKRGGPSQALGAPLLTAEQLVAIATRADLTVTA